jgi:hypothetical protein
MGQYVKDNIPYWVEGTEERIREVLGLDVEQERICLNYFICVEQDAKKLVQNMQSINLFNIQVGME